VDDQRSGPDTKQRLSVAQAADALGLTVDAVRSRIARNTIQHVRESGRVYVLLNSDEYRQGRDQYTDKGSDQASDLTDELRDRLHYVEQQLEAERQAHAEARRIIAGLVDRMPQLEAAADQHHVDEATDTDEVEDRASANRQKVRSQRRKAMLGLFFGVLYAIVGVWLPLTVLATGESVSGISASVRDAFATAISSGLSTVTGDQAAIIVSSIITLIGAIGAAYLTIRWGRGRRNP
jgi:hypothetical protein